MWQTSLGCDVYCRESTIRTSQCMLCCTGLVTNIVMAVVAVSSHIATSPGKVPSQIHALRLVERWATWKLRQRPVLHSMIYVWQGVLSLCGTCFTGFGCLAHPTELAMLSGPGRCRWMCSGLWEWDDVFPSVRNSSRQLGSQTVGEGKCGVQHSGFFGSISYLGYASDILHNLMPMSNSKNDCQRNKAVTHANCLGFA